VPETIDIATRMQKIGERLDTDPEHVLDALEAVVETVPSGSDEPAAQLSEHDASVLRESGLLRRSPAGATASPAWMRAAARYAQLLTSGLTVKEAAAQLLVTEGRVRQRLADSSLYGLPTPRGWRLPLFQFSVDGAALPGLEQVLAALPSALHPLSVTGFFTRSHPDLVIDGESVSPAEWLAAGGNVDAVVDLAVDVLVG
jgi:hypothetical protein